MFDFADNETVKQALREAIEQRRLEMERFIVQLKRIETEERRAEQAMQEQMQNAGR